MKERCGRKWPQRSFWCSLGEIWGWDHNPKQLNSQQRGQHRRLGNAHGARDDLVETNSVSFASAQARKLNHSVCFSFPHEVGYFVGTPTMAGHCVSKQIGRHDAACQGCPRCVFLARPSWGPRKAGRLCGERRSSVVIELSCLHGSERYAACFDEVVARTVRVSQPAVLSALLVIQLFGIVIPPPNFPKEHQKERCGHSRPQRSFITFYGALRNILLSVGFPVTVP